MDIIVKNLGKQFQEEWIFKAIDFHFQFGKTYAIIGPNGSGKSTFLQVISGFLPPSSGEVLLTNEQEKITAESAYRYLSVATPYLELIEEFSAKELLQFHFKFKTLINNMSVKDFLSKIDLAHTENKLLKNFSSGMKQRLKLGLAFYTDTPIMLLDEPTSNLDSDGIAWYHQLIANFKRSKLILICSNQRYEYEHCEASLNIVSYK